MPPVLWQEMPVPSLTDLQGAAVEMGEGEWHFVLKLHCHLLIVSIPTRLREPVQKGFQQLQGLLSVPLAHTQPTPVYCGFWLNSSHPQVAARVSTILFLLPSATVSP